LKFGSTLPLAEKDSEIMMRRYLQCNSNIQAKKRPALLLHRTQFFHAQSSLLSLHCHRLEGDSHSSEENEDTETPPRLFVEAAVSTLERFFAARRGDNCCVRRRDAGIATEELTATARSQRSRVHGFQAYQLFV
jgi:hypothetical protein